MSKKTSQQPNLSSTPKSCLGSAASSWRQVDPGAFRLAYDTENICNYLEVDLWDELDELDLVWVVVSQSNYAWLIVTLTVPFP